MAGRAPPAEAPNAKKVKKQTRLAILVGATYENTPNYLPGCALDVTALATFFPKSKYNVQKLVGEKAILDDLARALDEVPSNAEELCLFLSGHGFDKPDGPYFLFNDGSSLPLHKLIDFLKNVKKIPRLLILVDSCFSGGSTKETQREVAWNPLKDITAEGVIIFTACKHDELAHFTRNMSDSHASADYKDLSWFCYAVVSALAGHKEGDMPLLEFIGKVQQIAADTRLGAKAQSPSVKITTGTNLHSFKLPTGAKMPDLKTKKTKQPKKATLADPPVLIALASTMFGQYLASESKKTTEKLLQVASCQQLLNEVSAKLGEPKPALPIALPVLLPIGQ